MLLFILFLADQVAAGRSWVTHVIVMSPASSAPVLSVWLGARLLPGTTERGSAELKTPHTHTDNREGTTQKTLGLFPLNLNLPDFLHFSVISTIGGLMFLGLGVE